MLRRIVWLRKRVTLSFIQSARLSTVSTRVHPASKVPIVSDSATRGVHHNFFKARTTTTTRPLHTPRTSVQPRAESRIEEEGRREKPVGHPAPDAGWPRARPCPAALGDPVQVALDSREHRSEHLRRQ